MGIERTDGCVLAFGSSVLLLRRCCAFELVMIFLYCIRVGEESAMSVWKINKDIKNAVEKNLQLILYCSRSQHNNFPPPPTTFDALTPFPKSSPWLLARAVPLFRSPLLLFLAPFPIYDVYIYIYTRAFSLFLHRLADTLPLFFFVPLLQTANSSPSCSSNYCFL